jgi:hypothetical protein
MPPNEHLVLCGGATTREGGDADRLNLNLHGPSANVRLEIGDISRRLLANVSDVHADLIEIASYVYAADGAIRAEERQTRNLACGGGESSGS